jgi:ubiquinone/menaquinone biosynthesis C-methylase UbiE
LGTYARAGKREEIGRLELQAESLSQVIDKEIQLLNFRSGMKILEVGCGTGAISRKIANCVKPSQVLAVDMDPTFLDAAKQLTAKHRIDNIKFELGDAQNLKYEDRSFDASYCRLALSHVDDPLRAVNELKRVTKRGSLVTSSDEAGAFYTPPLPKLDKLIEKFYDALLASKRKHFRDAYSLFSSAGLKSIEVHHIPTFASHQNMEILREIAQVPLKMVEAEIDSKTEASVITKQEFEDAVTEFESWLRNPTAFWMVLSVLTLGRVP